MKTKIMILIAICFGCSCSSTVRIDIGQHGENIYTGYNLFFQNPEKMYDLNYKSGSMIPVGTRITNIRMGKHRKYRVIEFQTAKEGREFKIYWNPRNHLRDSTPEAFVKMVFTTEPFERLKDRLKISQAEEQAIKSGKVVNGMRKETVIYAWGPPHSKLTFSLESDKWIYQTSKWRKREVRFENGIVTDFLKEVPREGTQPRFGFGPFSIQ
ncbi:MAG: hypothetical protein GY757_52985 [bacterium]|nr:hypothetical protein [bacterium]